MSFLGPESTPLKISLNLFSSFFWNYTLWQRLMKKQKQAVNERYGIHFIFRVSCFIGLFFLIVLVLELWVYFYFVLVENVNSLSYASVNTVQFLDHIEFYRSIVETKTHNTIPFGILLILRNMRRSKELGSWSIALKFCTNIPSPVSYLEI